jgi:hypothetical protein
MGAKWIFSDYFAQNRGKDSRKVVGKTPLPTTDNYLIYIALM